MSPKTAPGFLARRLGEGIADQVSETHRRILLDLCILTGPARACPDGRKFEATLVDDGQIQIDASSEFSWLSLFGCDVIYRIQWNRLQLTRPQPRSRACI